MMLFYVDESGTGLNDRRSPFFVLSALSIAAKDAQLLDAEVAALKRRLVGWAKPEDFEIKGRDLRRGEKFFKGLSWAERADAFVQVARLLAVLPCRITAIQVDTRDLPDYVATDSDLYRLAFWRLLDELESYLTSNEVPGLIMADARSDLHSSVQDRRLIDAFREWVGSRSGRTHFVEAPWFGFSAFYGGLQLADFSAYLVDFLSNELPRSERDHALVDSFRVIERQVSLIRIP